MIGPPSDDAFASVLVDLASSVQIAPRLLPEEVGPGGRYRLEELIGIGHDSHVYRAIDQRLSKPTVPALVALKIRASQSSSRIEALIGRSVTHENVVRTIDHGLLDNGTTYIVQEWIPGGDFSELSLPMQPRDAVALLIPIARGIQALHAAGNIHGDLKPSNILRSAEGTPKIADFDMASAHDLGEVGTGGNLAFMAPERVLDATTFPSPSGDVFALGCMLYYFLTGDLPFGSEAETIRANHREPVAPDVRALDKDLANICKRAMDFDPQARYVSAEAFAMDLERWTAHLPIAWTQPSPRRRAALLWRRHPLRLILAGLAVATLVTAGGWIRVAATRDIEAQRRAVEIATADIEETRSKIRESMMEFVNSGMLGNKVRNGASLFEALAWVDMLAHTPLLGDQGPLMARDERIRSLLVLRDEYAATHRAGCLTDSMAAYSLTYCYIEAGQPAEAAEQLADARAGVLGSLPESDDARQSMNALGLLIEFMQAPRDDATRTAALREELGNLSRQFAWSDGSHSVTRLIRVILNR